MTVNCDECGREMYTPLHVNFMGEFCSADCIDIGIESRINCGDWKFVNELQTCCLCGVTIYNFGHNARPLGKHRCCDDCVHLVIISRIQDGVKD